jgi:hypothetical protein
MTHGLLCRTAAQRFGIGFVEAERTGDDLLDHLGAVFNDRTDERHASDRRLF